MTRPVKILVLILCFSSFSKLDKMSFYRNFFKVVEEINERNTFEINTFIAINEVFAASIYTNDAVELFSPFQLEQTPTCVEKQSFYQAWVNNCRTKAPPVII